MEHFFFFVIWGPLCETSANLSPDEKGKSTDAGARQTWLCHLLAVGLFFSLLSTLQNNLLQLVSLFIANSYWLLAVCRALLWCSECVIGAGTVLVFTAGPRCQSSLPWDCTHLPSFPGICTSLPVHLAELQPSQVLLIWNQLVCSLKEVVRF